MDLRIAIAGARDDLDELHSLYEEILDDDGLRPVRKSIEHGRPSEGEMGAEEIIKLVLDPDMITAVSSCVTAWLTARRSRLRVVIQGEGGSASVDAEGPDAVTEETVTQALEAASGEAARQ
jgi:hypothetical protein